MAPPTLIKGEHQWQRNQKIITNNQSRRTIYGYAVPASVKEDYDYLSSEEKEDGWIHYRKHWYHISDFAPVSRNAPEWMKEWDGYKSDSFFSGVLIKWGDPSTGFYSDEYIIGTYIG